MSDDLNAAVAAGVLGSEERFRELLRSVVEVARAIFARQGVVDLPPRRGDGRARLRGGRRRGRGDAARAALPRRHRHRRLGARHPDAARDRGRRPRPALRQGRRRGHRLRAAGADGRAAPLTTSGRSACSRCSTASRSSRSRRWSCSACSRTRPRSRSTCSSGRARRRPRSPATGDLAVVARLAAALEGSARRRGRRARLLEALEDGIALPDANEPGSRRASFGRSARV